MAIHFETTNPSVLLAAFKKAINDGHIVTWSYDKDGDFTHTPDQWAKLGWMRPAIFNGRLTMNFVGNNKIKTSPVIYAVYHGRFIESMLTHCDTLFGNATSTALATSGDLITKTA